ncbi:flagellar biosynthesis anti-sigma factor FlgM [Evansella clarkii]|jgi:negative regulator of flagellin synthesis FlgM|uniref:flagellar biosynthesis anti-sigma factor FlgM n=1 Tax=Evansella clarkii TaxID=79879 RepID=UPI000B454EA8|nr:flagellar biosynthesis anti-sigma factor FlgM [Evansella clarkii]
MKINPMHSVNAYRKQQGVSQQQQAGQPNKRDEVQISSDAKKMQQSSQVSLERQEKIRQLKEKIDNGTYKADAHETARKFYDFWNEK